MAIKRYSPYYKTFSTLFFSLIAVIVTKLAEDWGWGESANLRIHSAVTLFFRSLLKSKQQISNSRWTRGARGSLPGPPSPPPLPTNCWHKLIKMREACNLFCKLDVLFRCFGVIKNFLQYLFGLHPQCPVHYSALWALSFCVPNANVQIRTCTLQFRNCRRQKLRFLPFLRDGGRQKYLFPGPRVNTGGTRSFL